MAIAASSGYPQYSGTVVPNKIWSKKLNIKFYEHTFFNDIANTDYQGEIKNQGDTVTIRTTPTITTTPYIKGQSLNTERPEPGIVELVINRGRYFNFVTDDVDRHQSDYDYIEDWTSDAAKQMKIAIQLEMLGNIYPDAHAKNKGATAGVETGGFNLGATGAFITLDKTNIIEYLIDLGTVLSEQNVPDEGLWVILPPKACGLIKKSDLKDASLSGDPTSMARTGRIGMIDNMTIYKSNQLTKVLDGATTVTNIIAGHKSALTFAHQLTKSNTLVAESTFGTIFRSLQVYDWKVIKPEALAVLYAKV